MCQARIRLIATAVALMTALPAMAAEPERATGRDGLTVHRGNSIEVVGQSAAGNAVTIYRGSGVSPTSIGLTRKRRGVAVVGGDEQIWFVDPNNGRLTNCRFRVTSTVGRDQIRCIRARLP